MTWLMYLQVNIIVDARVDPRRILMDDFETKNNFCAFCSCFRTVVSVVRKGIVLFLCSSHEPRHEKNKGAEQPISTFVIRCLDSTISVVSICKISKPLAGPCS